MKAVTMFRKLVRPTIAAAAIAATAVPVSASAEETQPAFTMTVFSDSIAGRKVLAGKYEQAIARINGSRHRYNSETETNTNLCVAYTKAGELENAEIACDAAVEAMRAEVKATVGAKIPSKARGQRDFLAAALSNRGVLRAITGKRELALDDFREAVSLRGNISAPEVNLARAERKNSERPES